MVRVARVPDQPIKVLYLVTVSESLVFLEGRSRWMAERGVEMIVCSAPDDRLTAFGVRENCTVVGIPISRSVDPRQDIAAVRELRRAIERHRPTIVHCMTPKAGLVGTVAARLARTPTVVYEIYGLPHDSATGVQRQVLAWSERVSCALADRVYAVSKSMRSIALRDRLARRRKLRMFLAGSANGVDADGTFSPASSAGRRLPVRIELAIDADAFVVLFVGRLTRDKGIRELAEAWTHVSACNPDAHLVVVGEEDSRVPLDHGVMEALNSLPRTHLVGHVPHDRVPQLMAAADLLVLPTYREGYPYALLEAASMALPVVATSVPGCVDAVDDEVTGLLVPPRDAQALAAAIDRYADDEQLRSQHGSNGRDRVMREFRQEQVWEAVLREYRDLTKAERA